MMETAEGHSGGAGRRAEAGAGGRGSARFGGRAWLAVALGVALLLAVRLWRAGESCLWFDELFGLHAARMGWGGLLRFVSLDLIHPPLFYLLLKVWIALGGESVWWLRLFSVAASAAAVVPFVLLARELRLRAWTVALAVGLMATSGYLVKYAQEVRMYAPLLLLAACSLWLFARLCNADGGGRARAALALACANLPLVYTHYFGWLLVALELLFLLAWRRGHARPFAWSAGALALLFAPWAWAVWRAASAAGAGVAQNIGWASRPRAGDLLLPYLLLHEPFRFQQHSHEPAVLRLDAVLAVTLFAPPLLALAWRALARRRTTPTPEAGRLDAGAATPGGGPGMGDGPRAGLAAGDEGGSFALRFLVFFSAAPVVLTFALAHALPHSVWGTRHLIVVAPAYLLLAAHAVASVRPGWLAGAACALLAGWLLLAAGLALTRRHTEPVWCAWGRLAREAAASSGETARDGVPATPRDEGAARRDGDATPRDGNSTRVDEGGARGDEGAAGRGGRLRVYAFEDLVAYHLWHESGGGRAFDVAVVRGVEGAAEDKAFFLPRGFGGVAVLGDGEAFGEERFWLAFRAARRDGGHPVLESLAARGYRVARRHEVSSQGQSAFFVLLARR